MLTIDQLKEGNTLKIVKYRGEPDEYEGRIVAIRDTHADPVTAETHRDRVMTRSRFMLTVAAVNPKPEQKRVRSFYHAFVELANG